jgi:hypothetical protein
MKKEELLKIILDFLKENQRTQLASIRSHIDTILREKGIIGIHQQHIGGAIHTTNVRTPDETALYINDIIYNLMYRDRIITPGYNKDNLDLPWLHVSDLEKLDQLLNELL